MKKYHVQTEARGFAFEVVVEAESMSDAVKLVRETLCETRTVEITPSPTWVEPAPENPEEGYEIYEYSNRIYGDCEDCGLVLFEQGNPEGNDWPWQHTNGDDGHYTNICYPCAQKRKAAGNHCPYYKRYFRDERVCCECPKDKCPRSQERFYRNANAQLREARSFYQQQQNEELNKFLEHNELGLAYELLMEEAQKTKDPNHQSLEVAKLLMDEGWMG